MQVMMQVSKLTDIKDPSAAYTPCIHDSDLETCLEVIGRLSLKGYLHTRWFIQHDDGSESHHGDNA